MADLANLKIAVDSRQVKTADSDLNRLAKSAGKAETATTGVARASSALGIALKGLGIGLIAMEVIRMADAYTTMTSKVRLVTSSQAELVAVQARLFQVSTGTRTALESTTELYARMARSAGQLGVSQNEVLRVTEAINKATVVSGATAAEAQAGIIQLAQGFASGALRGDELRSVLEQMPRVATMIAEGMGITVGQLREFGAQGKLTSKQVFDSILKMAGTVDDEFARMPMTVGQSLTNLKSYVTRFVGDLNAASGFSTALANSIQFLATHLNQLAAILAVVVVRFAAMRAALAVQAVTSYLGQLIALERALGATSRTSALFSISLKGVQSAFRALTIAMMANPFVAVATAITAVLGLMYVYRDAQIKLGQDTVTIANIFVGAWDYVKKAFTVVQTAFAEGWEAALTSISPVLGAVGRAFDVVMRGIYSVVSGVINKTIGLFAGLASAISALFTGGDVVGSFTKAFNRDYVGGFITVIRDGIVALNNHGASLRKNKDETVNLDRAMGDYVATQTAAEKGDDKAAKALQDRIDQMKDYIKGLREAREEIGLNEIALKRLEIARAMAQIDELVKAGMPASAAAQMRQELADAGASLINAMQGDMVKQVRDANAALREQVELFWESAAAQAAARAAREGKDMGLEGDNLTQFIDEAVVAAGLQATLEGLEEVKQALEDVRALTFDIDLEGVFGSWGKALAGTVNAMQGFLKRQELIAKAMKAQNLSEKDMMMLRDKALRNQINFYGNLASAAKGYFREGSAGYKALTAAETAFRAIEFALSVKATIQKVQEGAAKMFAELGPLGFAAVAAMLGVMVGLGFGGGGGSSSKAPTYNTGTGTVLGDPDAKSESLIRALDLLNETSDLTMRYSSQMAMSLKKIENNIGGLSRMVLTSGGLEASAAGIKSSGGLWGALFGSKREIVGQGISGVNQSLNSILSGGFNGQYFTDVKKTKKFLGITTGTSYYTQYSPMEAALKTQIGGFFANVADVIKTAGVALGYSLSDIEARLNSYVVSIGKINLKDLTGDEVTRALEAALGAEADKMAQFAVGGLEKFQKVGEGYFETLVRAAATLEAFTQAMQYLDNQTQVTLDSVMAIADLFGDLGEMQQSMQYFFNAFYSDAEKLAYYTSNISATLSDMGLVMPTTVEQYKAMVSALDLNTEAGQEAFYTLLQLAPLFTEVIKLQEQTAQAAIDQQNKLEANLLAAYKRETAELQKTIDQFQRFADSLRKFRDSLFATTSAGQSYTQALSRLMSVGALAATGDATALGDLQGVAQTFLSAAKDRAGTLLEYQRAVALVSGYVTDAIDAAEGQVTEAQRQMAVLERQASTLMDISDHTETMQEALVALAHYLGVPVPTGALPQGATQAGATAEEQRQTREHLDRLDRTMREGFHTVGKHTQATSKLLDRWDGDGQPDIRETELDYY